MDPPDTPVDLPAPLSAEDGIEVEDTSFPYGDSPEPNSDEPIDQGDDVENAGNASDEAEAAMDDAPVDPGNSEAMVDMITLMDTMQSLGVDVVKANRFVASLIRSRPPLFE